MISIKKFTFNDFQVHTLVLYDESKECIIVDAACYEDAEKKELVEFIKQEGLKPQLLIITHCHVDHILGTNLVCELYNIGLAIHKEGEVFLQGAAKHAKTYGFNIAPIIKPAVYLEDKQVIKFGNSVLEILYTPGHADGSICLINHPQKFVISGDLLFQGSIGRTDFPTGNFETLKKNI